MKSHPRFTQPNSISSYARATVAAALLILGAAMFSIAASGGGGSASGKPNASTDNFQKGPAVDTSSVIVQLKGDPLSKNSSTKPAPGKKIDFNSTNVKSYRAQLSAQRNDFKQWLHTYAPKAKVTSQYDISLNAVAVQLNGESRDTIAGAPMVQQVQYNALYHPDLSESHKIINADGAWNAAGGRSSAGAGIKIGDIDTGIDETHPFFDPSGFTYPPGFPKCDAADSATHTANHNCHHVSPQVIVAKVFNNDLLAIGLDNAVEAGVSVAVAAGNSGPGGGTVESPGRARNVITVGASTNQHFVGQPFAYPASGGTTVGAAVGDFDALPGTSFNLFDTASDGCTSVPAGASGDLAIINRGNCTFSQKVANAKAAGAVAVLIVNNVAGDPIAMARTAGFDDNIPAVMIGLNEGAALRASAATTASADATFQEFITANKDILAGFSSQGPTAVNFD